MDTISLPDALKNIVFEYAREYTFLGQLEECSNMYKKDKEERNYEEGEYFIGFFFVYMIGTRHIVTWETHTNTRRLHEYY